MAEETARESFHQVVLLLVEGLGIGAQADAGPDEGRGADTLGHVATYVGGLDLPFFQWLGIGNAHPLRGMPPAEPPAASVGRVRRVTPGLDREGAVRELLDGCAASLVHAGVPVQALGWAAGCLGDDEVSAVDPEVDPEILAQRLASWIRRLNGGLVVAGWSPPHPGGGPVAMARTLSWLDGNLPTILDAADAATLLILVGVGGRDATLGAVGVTTREIAPILAYTPAVPSGIDLGLHGSLADVGATVAENFGVSSGGRGESFFGPLLA